MVLIAVPKPALFGGNAACIRPCQRKRPHLEGDILNDILHDNEFKADPIQPMPRLPAHAEAIAGLLRRAGAV